MTEPAAGGGAQPRAYLTVGGRTIAQHQLDLALALECRRVICLAPRMAPELIALRDEAAAAGAQLQVVPGARALTAQVTSDDELFVFAEGLLAQPPALLALLAPGEGVLLQPIGMGLAAGFERVDAERASGGAMRLPGALVARLGELPADCDVISALLRIALQAQVPTRDIPEEARAGVRWKLVRGEADAQAIESDWIALHIGVGRGATPSEKLARAAIAAFGPSLLHAGGGSRMLALGAAAVIVVALAFGWLGVYIAAFVLVAIAAPMARGAGLLSRVETGSIERRGPRVPPARALGWLIDAAIVLLAGWTAAHAPGAAFVPSAFPPVMLVCVLRLLPRVVERRWWRWLSDRATVALALALGAGFDALTDTVRVLAAGLAIAALVLAPR